MNSASRKSLKSRPDSEELRERRVGEVNNLRKQRREEELNQKRNISDGDIDHILEDVEMLDMNNNVPKSPIKVEVMRHLYSEDKFHQLAAALTISKMLLWKPTRSSDVIALGMIPRFFELLKNEKDKMLQLTAASVLTDVTVNSIQHVLPETAIPTLAQLLSSNADAALKKQVLMVLGNIAGDSPELRDKVLKSGSLITILGLLDNNPSLSMTRNSVWVLLNLCSGKDPAPEFDLVSRCIPMLAKLINHEDYEVISDACWALSNLCEGFKAFIQIIINVNVCPRLVELLSFKQSNNVIAAAIHTIGDIVSGSEGSAQVIIDCQALTSIRGLLSHEKPEIIKDACWTISNISLGCSDQIQTLIDANIFPIVLSLLQTGSNEIQREASWAVRQIISRRRTKLVQLNYFVSIGFIKSLIPMMTTSAEEILQNVLKTLRDILDFKVPEHLTEVQNHSSCSLSLLRSLEANQDYNISKYAAHILNYLE